MYRYDQINELIDKPVIDKKYSELRSTNKVMSGLFKAPPLHKDDGKSEDVLQNLSNMLQKDINTDKVTPG